ncbi:MAG TPA: ATP-dependent DNA ligase, partial [Gemmatimonadaceae bacterium]|nr:ATP-dependent DNA ligase [Gemmatimonadaceae bacterium]
QLNPCFDWKLRIPEDYDLIKPPYLPMEARTVAEIPEDDGWQYEPKWDGFRCLAFRDGKTVKLQSKSGQPLERYFPELVAALLDLAAKQFVLDGEIIVPVDGALSFDDLLQRIHPAASRILKLSVERAAQLIVFDILTDEKGKSLVELPLEARREHLETFAKRFLKGNDSIRLSPATTEMPVVRKWFKAVGSGLDGVIAKRLDMPYMSGDRTGMVKVKHRRTADCVVGGFRYAEKARVIGSMLLGLYDDDGLLHHVGFTSAFTAKERSEFTPKLEKLIKPPGFTGQAPGGPSRWSTKRSTEWEPLAPKLVVEVEYDHFTNGRFRHGTKLLRWRPDKAPRQCTLDQVGPEKKSPLGLLNEKGKTRK